MRHSRSPNPSYRSTYTCLVSSSSLENYACYHVFLIWTSVHLNLSFLLDLTTILPSIRNVQSPGIPFQPLGSASRYTHQRREYQLSAKLIVLPQIFVNLHDTRYIYIYERLFAASVSLSSHNPGSVVSRRQSYDKCQRLRNGGWKLSLCSF